MLPPIHGKVDGDTCCTTGALEIVLQSCSGVENCGWDARRRTNMLYTVLTRYEETHLPSKDEREAGGNELEEEESIEEGGREGGREGEREGESEVTPQRVLTNLHGSRPPTRAFCSTIVCSSKVGERQPRTGGQRRNADKKKAQIVSEFQPGVYEGMDSVKKHLSDGRCVVVLQPGKSKLFYDGNPVVFGGAVQGVLGNPGCLGEKDFTMLSIIRKRLQNAAGWRTSLARSALTCFPAAIRSALNLPNEATSAYRLINGEGDRLSGVAIDVYSNWVVISSSARWVEIHKDVILKAVEDVVPAGSEIVWRQSVDRLRQDGFDIPTRASRSTAEDEEDAELSEPAVVQEPVESAIITEFGVKFLVSPKLGQKTGHYLDQRDNRYLLGEL
eukprot:753370-Hanusia_phi.AAC.6